MRYEMNSKAITNIRKRKWQTNGKTDGMVTRKILDNTMKNRHGKWTTKVRNGQRKFHKFLTFFNLTVKFDLKTYKTCTFLELASNLRPEKVPYCFLDQHKILTLP
jgi:hypothetical protein